MATFSGMQAARLAGVGLRMMLNWERAGLVAASLRTPSGRRVFTFRDVVAVRVARMLREHGFESGPARRMVAYVQAHEGISESIPFAPTLLVMRKDKIFEAGRETPLESLVGQSMVTTIIALDEVVNELQNTACPPRRAPKRRKSNEAAPRVSARAA